MSETSTGTEAGLTQVTITRLGLRDGPVRVVASAACANSRSKTILDELRVFAAELGEEQTADAENADRLPASVVALLYAVSIHIAKTLGKAHVLPRNFWQGQTCPSCPYTVTQDAD